VQIDNMYCERLTLLQCSTLSRHCLISYLHSSHPLFVHTILSSMIIIHSIKMKSCILLWMTYYTHSAEKFSWICVEKSSICPWCAHSTAHLLNARIQQKCCWLRAKFACANFGRYIQNIYTDSILVSPDISERNFEDDLRIKWSFEAFITKNYV